MATESKKDLFYTWDKIDELVKAVKSGSKTAESLVNKSLELAKKFNPEYNVIISLLEDKAISRAKKIDEKVKVGENPGRLSGVPFIAKDNFKLS